MINKESLLTQESLLIGTLNFWGILNLSTGKIIKIEDQEGGMRRAWGSITFDGKYIYVMKQVAESREHVKESDYTRVYVYDYDFNNIEIINLPESESGSGHQIMYGSNHLWVMASQKEIMYTIDPGKNFEYKKWKPSVISGKQGLRINSFLVTEDKIHIMSVGGNGVKSQIITFDINNVDNIKFIGEKTLVSDQCHKIWEYNNEMYYCSSYNGSVHSVFQPKELLKGSGYSNGVAMNDEFLIVAFSPLGDRSYRESGNGIVRIYNKNTYEFIKEYEIDGSGNIPDLKFLYGIDYCHPITLILYNGM